MWRAGHSPDRSRRCDTEGVPLLSDASYHYAVGPVIAFVVVGILIGLCRWIFGPSRSRRVRTERPAGPRDYGLLVPVAIVADEADADLLREVVVEHGIRCTVAPAEGPTGYAVLVFRDDVQRAKSLVR